MEQRISSHGAHSQRHEILYDVLVIAGAHEWYYGHAHETQNTARKHRRERINPHCKI